MRRLSLALATAFFLPAMPRAVFPQQPPSPTTLPALRDRYRPLLLFAASPEDPSLLAQLHAFKDNQAALQDRNILVVVVPYNTPSTSPVSLTPEAALDARRLFHVAPPDFTAILLGKDGGEKLRSEKPLSLKRLCSTIDAMPMRQEEMQSASPP